MNNFHYHQDPLYSAAASILEGVADIQTIVKNFAVGDNTNFGKVLEIGSDSITFKAKDLPKTKISFGQRKMGSSEYVLSKLTKLKEETDAEVVTEETITAATVGKITAAQIEKYLDSQNFKAIEQICKFMTDDELETWAANGYDGRTYELLMKYRKKNEGLEEYVSPPKTKAQQLQNIKDRRKEHEDAIAKIRKRHVGMHSAERSGDDMRIIDMHNRDLAKLAAREKKIMKMTESYAGLDDTALVEGTAWKILNTTLRGLGFEPATHSDLRGFKGVPKETILNLYGIPMRAGKWADVWFAILEDDSYVVVSGNQVYAYDHVGDAIKSIQKIAVQNSKMSDINEVLDPNDDAAVWIDDFVKSDDPRFEGKSKEERIKMALGAWYAAQKKESVQTVKESETIVEEKSILKALPEKVVDFLLYLIHDKSHVMGNTYKDPNMEKVFALTKNDTFNKPLYRGLYKETLDDFKVGEVTTMDRYQSFSEHESIAKQFSQKGLILKAVKSKGGFNYGGFLVDYYNDLKVRAPRDYMMDDGGFMIESAEEEAEHIFPIGAQFKVTAIKGNLIEGTII